MAYFQATGWLGPVDSGPSAPTPGPISSLLSAATDWMTSHAPPPPPPAPSTSSMFTLASGVAQPVPAPASSSKPQVKTGGGMTKLGMLAAGLGAVGLFYLVVR